MNVRRLVLLAVPLLAFGAVVALWPQEALTPEDEVRALVARAVAGAEKRDVAAVAETMAEGFKGGGGMSRQETKQLVAGVLLRSPKGTVVLNPSLSVKVESAGSATFRGTFVFVQQGAPGQGGELGRYDISGRASKGEDGWRFDSAEWAK